MYSGQVTKFLIHHSGLHYWQQDFLLFDFSTGCLLSAPTSHGSYISYIRMLLGQVVQSSVKITQGYCEILIQI